MAARPFVAGGFSPGQRQRVPRVSSMSAVPARWMVRSWDRLVGGRSGFARNCAMLGLRFLRGSAHRVEVPSMMFGSRTGCPATRWSVIRPCGSCRADALLRSPLPTQFASAAARRALAWFRLDSIEQLLHRLVSVGVRLRSVCSRPPRRSEGGDAIAIRLLTLGAGAESLRFDTQAAGLTRRDLAVCIDGIIANRCRRDGCACDSGSGPRCTHGSDSYFILTYAQRFDAGAISL